MRKNLTWDTILEEVTEEAIFSYYIGRFVIGGVQRSPLRKDYNPSFSIRRTKNGGLGFIDYADDSARGNGATFVMKKFGLNYNEALEKIDLDLNLGIRFPKKTNHTLPKVKIIELPQKKEITIIKKEFTYYDWTYWQDFSSKEDLLKERNDEGQRLIYSVKRYFVNGVEGLIIPDERVYCYNHGKQGKKALFCRQRKMSFQKQLIQYFHRRFFKLGRF